MRYKHIVWDWNGTLLNDLWLFIESINFVLESRGMSQVDKESYKSIFTFPVIKYYEHLGFDFSKEKFPIPGFLTGIHYCLFAQPSVTRVPVLLPLCLMIPPLLL